jgi:hypothetical protein
MAEIGSRTCKPNSVCRVAPAGRPFLWAAHCYAALATYPGVVARRAGTRATRRRRSSPIWSCSVWGLPCPRHYCRGGALLPHLFTLTRALRPRRYVFCGTSRRPGLNPASRMLSGTLLCGVRTFLPCPPRKGAGAAVRSGCQQLDYKAVVGGQPGTSVLALPWRPSGAGSWCALHERCG